MREPAGTLGGGLGGGRSKTGAAGGGGSAGGGSKAGAAGKSSEKPALQSQGSPTDGATANKTEGVRAFGTGAGSPVGVGIWSDPTHQEGPYPSHLSENTLSLEAGQQSQSKAAMRCSAMMSNSSQYARITCRGV